MERTEYVYLPNVKDSWYTIRYHYAASKPFSRLYILYTYTPVRAGRHSHWRRDGHLQFGAGSRNPPRRRHDHGPRATADRLRATSTARTRRVSLACRAGGGQTDCLHPNHILYLGAGCWGRQRVRMLPDTTCHAPSHATCARSCHFCAARSMARSGHTQTTLA